MCIVDWIWCWKMHKQNARVMHNKPPIFGRINWRRRKRRRKSNSLHQFECNSSPIECVILQLNGTSNYVNEPRSIQKRNEESNIRGTRTACCYKLSALLHWFYLWLLKSREKKNSAVAAADAIINIRVCSFQFWSACACVSLVILKRKISVWSSHQFGSKRAAAAFFSHFHHC